MLTVHETVSGLFAHGRRNRVSGHEAIVLGADASDLLGKVQVHGHGGHHVAPLNQLRCGPRIPHAQRNRARNASSSGWNVDRVGWPVIGSAGVEVSSKVSSGYCPTSNSGTPENAVASEIPSIIMTVPAGRALEEKTGMSNLGPAINLIVSACAGCVTIVGSRPA